MELKVLKIDGTESGKNVVLDERVFGIQPNEHAIYLDVVQYLANKRQGTAKTKDRSEIAHSTKKLGRQKGGGGARHGSLKANIFVGGGRVFGPKPRDFSYSIPKKAKRLAMKTILSMKAKNNRLVVVEDFTIEDGKTRKLVDILNKLSVREHKEKVVIILKDDDIMLRRAGRNIPNVSFLSYNRLRAHDLFYGRKIVLLETSVKKLSEFYAKLEEAE